MNIEAQFLALLDFLGWINQGKAKGIPALEHRWRNPKTKMYGHMPSLTLDMMYDAEAMIIGFPAWDRYVESISKLDNRIHISKEKKMELFIKSIEKWTES